MPTIRNNTRYPTRYVVEEQDEQGRTRARPVLELPASGAHLGDYGEVQADAEAVKAAKAHPAFSAALDAGDVEVRR
jgi:hypothetical protein